jgi:hypothetical protein
VKRRSGLSIGISKLVEVILNKFEQGNKDENPSDKYMYKKFQLLKAKKGLPSRTMVQ